MNLHLRDLSGEEIGDISSSNKKVVIPGVATGGGRFKDIVNLT
jgi:hypothetical protein